MVLFKKTFGILVFLQVEECEHIQIFVKQSSILDHHTNPIFEC